MAERKVSGKSKKNTENGQDKTKAVSLSRDSAYDDFITLYSKQLRQRTTRTVEEPQKPHQYENVPRNDIRCEEINPHLSLNPAAEHHILTKRTGRILADDTGFKANDYYNRFELKAEMPEIEEKDDLSFRESLDGSLDGQQTMADIISASDSDELTAVPVESKITENEENIFGDIYNTIKSSRQSFGKSEKLRAIARTAAADAEMEPESQISFPAFDPLFKFDDTPKPSKRKQIAKHGSKNVKKSKKEIKAELEAEIFDIKEDELAVLHDSPEDKTQEEAQAPEKPKKRSRHFFDAAFSEQIHEQEPAFEINSKADIGKTRNSIRKTIVIQAAKVTMLTVYFVILCVISALLSNLSGTDGKNLLPLGIASFAVLSLSAVLCIKDIFEGFRDFKKKRLSLNGSCLMIFAASFLQTGAACASGKVTLLSPAALFAVILIILSKLLLGINSETAVSLMTAAESISIFRPLSEGGIEGVISEKHSNNGGNVRSFVKTRFASGMMKLLTNAVPRQFGGNLAYIFSAVFSLLAAIACAIINESTTAAITAFCAMLTASLPVAYTFSAAVLLLSENRKASDKGACLISYKSASNVAETSAAVFSCSDITENSSCSIHSTKLFGTEDMKKAVLCCAAAAQACDSPLAYILTQAAAQGDDEIPEAEAAIAVSGGIAAVVDGNKVLLGSKQFLESNRIIIPNDDYEEKYLTGDRKLLFLSLNGKLCMMFIVSYHIPRSTSSLFKYLAKNGISILIHSCDPNITDEYIAKKCRIDKSLVFILDDAQSAYFKDKESKTESSVPCDVFTNGKLSALFALMKSAVTLKKVSFVLSTVAFALSAIAALAVAITVLISDISNINNAYIIILNIICTLSAIVFPAAAAKKEKNKKQ